MFADGRVDVTDHALDVWVDPDGSWRWKDEDDFAALQRHGVFDAAAARRVRAEGERVIEAWPFPTGWEDWRPDPRWPTPELPDDWHVVD
jgi:predicted RNA-binding protein associated with RNAse of E/G family